MPGIESRAPERTETSSGSVGSPSRRPARCLEARDAVGDLLGQPGGLGCGRRA